MNILDISAIHPSKISETSIKVSTELTNKKHLAIQEIILKQKG